MSNSPRFGSHDVDRTQCGYEVGDGICGATATVWCALDDDSWNGYQAAACTEHADILTAFPAARISSDAPLEAGEAAL